MKEENWLSYLHRIIFERKADKILRESIEAPMWQFTKVAEPEGFHRNQEKEK